MGGARQGEREKGNRGNSFVVGTAKKGGPLREGGKKRSLPLGKVAPPPPQEKKKLRAEWPKREEDQGVSILLALEVKGRISAGE